ncbi:MAG: DUF3450 domain-containing protein [Gammaproteobacteria bacterium]|nr:DUF3450 domain-containing protein [Gammaproteobacteria bacterium]
MHPKTGSSRASALGLLMLVLAAPGFAADPAKDDGLKQAVTTQSGVDAAARSTQTRIDAMSTKTQQMVEDYKYTLRQTESLRLYNNHLEKLIDSQVKEMESIKQQMVSIEETNREIIPLIMRMTDTLSKFIELDAPFLKEERGNRVGEIRDMINRADVTVAEKYRRIMEAYQIELEYSRTIEAYHDVVAIGGKDVTVDILRVGRVALMYQTLDGSDSGIWNNGKRAWEELPGKYDDSIQKGLRIARKQAAPELITMPVKAPEAIQ